MKTTIYLIENDIGMFRAFTSDSSSMWCFNKEVAISNFNSLKPLKFEIYYYLKKQFPDCKTIEIDTESMIKIPYDYSVYDDKVFVLKSFHDSVIFKTITTKTSSTISYRQEEVINEYQREHITLFDFQYNMTNTYDVINIISLNQNDKINPYELREQYRDKMIIIKNNLNMFRAIQGNYASHWEFSIYNARNRASSTRVEENTVIDYLQHNLIVEVNGKDFNGTNMYSNRRTVRTIRSKNKEEDNEFGLEDAIGLLF